MDAARTMSLPSSLATHTSDAFMRPTSQLIQRRSPHWHKSVLELRSQRAADRVQVPQNLDVGVDETSLVVGDAVLLAERAHRLLGVPQAGPRHGGEQVMLDLVIQAAEREVGEPAAADVTRSDHLAVEEIDLLILAKYGHALVIGRKRASEVDPEHALLDEEEGHRLHRGQHQEHRSQIADDVCGEEDPLH